jgi:hypothetical protein
MPVLNDEGTMKAKTSRIFKTWIVALEEEEFFLYHHLRYWCRYNHAALAAATTN